MVFVLFVPLVALSHSPQSVAPDHPLGSTQTVPRSKVPSSMLPALKLARMTRALRATLAKGRAQRLNYPARGGVERQHIRPHTDIPHRLAGSGDGIPLLVDAPRRRCHTRPGVVWPIILDGFIVVAAVTGLVVPQAQVPGDTHASASIPMLSSWPNSLIVTSARSSEPSAMRRIAFIRVALAAAIPFSESSITTQSLVANPSRPAA